MGCKWAYAITTCAERVNTTLKRTVDSLAAAGWENPRIACDGHLDLIPHWFRHYRYSIREQRCFTYANWVLTAHELTLLNPDADRFLICQDDVVLCKNLRQYLEATPWPDLLVYLNLVTYPANEAGQAEIDSTIHIPDEPWLEREGVVPYAFHPSNQRGKGAQCLVFDRASISSLLTSIQFYMRRFDMSMDALGRRKGTRNIDGGMCDAFKMLGFREYCHTPSLATHDCSVESSMLNPKQPVIRSFVGEDFDAMSITYSQRFQGSFS